MRNILKPYGAFVEYTLKPLLDDTKEILELVEKQGIPVKELKRVAIFLYIYHELMQFIMTCAITGAICLTVSKIVR